MTIRLNSNHIMKKNIYLISLLLLTTLGCAQEKSNLITPESVGLSSKKLDTLKSELHKYVDDGSLAGIQTAILKNNTLVYFDSYGYADVENTIPLDDKSIFRIFSMTKPITSVGLMVLYEQGKFQLDDPLYKYIPEFRNMTTYDENNNIIPVKNAIKIIDLLRHSSGISYGRSPNSNLNNLYTKENLGNSKNLKAFIDKISKLPLLFEPGTAYEYGYSTDICGYLIEVLSGQPVNEYLKEKVLNPLKMNDTHFQLPKDKIQHLTVGYSTNDNGKLEIADIPNQNMFVNEVTFYKAGGGLVSTTNDYLNFCRMLLNKGIVFDKQILKPETLDLMTKDHLESVRKHTPRLRILPRETGFGLGFSITKQEDGSIVYGWGGAVGTYFRVDPERDLAYVMMIQISPYRQLHLRETFQKLVNNSIINKTKVKNIINPILLDKAMLSGIGLKQVDLKDQPNREFYQSQVYKGKEINVFMISSSTASKDFDNFSIDEFVYLSKGSMNFKSEENKTFLFKTGDFIAIPKGYSGSIETVGKPKYHLELSIISNKRADKEMITQIKHPFTIDKHLISGKNIKLNDNGIYRNVVYSGLEIEIILEAEKPRTTILEHNLIEKCIHVLEGSVAITPKNGKTYTFKTGDFFILPVGFIGKVKSKSQKLYRTIKVSAIK